MATGEFFDHSQPPPVERLARIEGQSNFLSLLAGVEAGPDTTIDMGALSFARSRGCVPEVLEANVAQSALFKLPLMSMVWRAVQEQFAPKEKDWPWIQGAIADGFLLLRTGQCKSLGFRSRRFKVDISAYSAMRKVAYSVLVEMVDTAERKFNEARKRGDLPESYTGSEMGEEYRRASGHFIARPFASAESGGLSPRETRGIGVSDRLGWDDRNAAPSPVTEPLERSGASTADSGEGEP